MRLWSPDVPNYLIVHADLTFRADEALVRTEIEDMSACAPSPWAPLASCLLSYPPYVRGH